MEQVTNRELEQLSEKLGIAHITLLKKTLDNIILYRSSDSNELGLKTDSWDPWYEAFQQLFRQRNVTIPWGQSLPHFWTGPFEMATSDTSQIHKWGYYYDGTTNYIIDPYIKYDDRQLAYETKTGVGSLIRKTLESNETLLEIGVLNPSTFPLGEQVTVTDKGELLEHKTQRPVIYGTNDFRHAEDERIVERVHRLNEPFTVNAKLNNRHVLKMYIPVTTAPSASMVDEHGEPMDRYVMTLVADYQSVQQTLDEQFAWITVTIVIVTLVSLAIAYAIMASYRKSENELARRAQETYADEVNALFTSIREQRHDFMNHVQTIHSLAAAGRTEELRAYTRELTGDIRELNDILHIGNPAIAALIRAKISQAEQLKIRFASSFEGINMELGVQSLDMTRVLGNLIDNAFDEQANVPEERREVVISGRRQGGMLEFIIRNARSTGSRPDANVIFSAGYTTKGRDHSGLGLSIVRSIVAKYKGAVDVRTDEPESITFIVRIPHE
ncbi:sensor histidine kinase [Paenibacillus aurantiacus]|uniref:Sensor histidine kinase n=1 Tax=Paenibacillus aurantiacus TaxID=1936118 RepID=A0ABV5L166_9BACL